MRALAGAVNIITSMQAGHRYGMTATAVCSASADPPTVLACINRLATTHGAVAKSKAFCVNVLRAEDWELSTTFSGAQSGEARFKSRDWTRLATGSPVLIDALVSFDCRVVKKLAHGTHTIFLGQVEQVDQVAPVGSAPTSAQVVPGNRLEFSGRTGRGHVVSRDDIVHGQGVPSLPP